MEPVFRYLLQNYHILGVLLIVTIIAIKLFATTRHAKKMIEKMHDDSRIDDIIVRLERIETALDSEHKKE